MQWLRRRFITGFFVTIPLVISVAAIVWIFGIIDRFTAPLASRVLGREVPGLGLLVMSREGVVSVARPDGTGPRRISPEGMLLRGPRWSTDGTRIAAWGGPIPSTSSIHPGTSM